MRRAWLAAIAGTAALAAAVPAAAQPPNRQQCVAVWDSDSYEDWGSAIWYKLSGGMSCGFDAPTYLPSSMNLWVEKATCNAGLGSGGVEVRAQGQDFWQHMDLTWGPGGGALTLTDPESAGPAYITPYYDLKSSTVCPVAFQITSAFVYNALDGTKIPPAR